MTAHPSSKANVRACTLAHGLSLPMEQEKVGGASPSAVRREPRENFVRGSHSAAFYLACEPSRVKSLRGASRRYRDVMSELMQELIKAGISLEMKLQV